MLRLALMSIVGVAVLSVAAYGDDSSTPVSTLPRNTIVSLDVVTRYFPEITKEASTGPNDTAVGNPIGTRAAIFTNADGTKKVTLSVDRYASAQDASSAFEKAVSLSKAAPGFNPAPAPTLGERAFAGTSQVGEEMHFGLGARKGERIMSATYAGFPVTHENSKNLVTLGGLVLDANEKTSGS